MKLSIENVTIGYMGICVLCLSVEYHIQTFILLNKKIVSCSTCNCCFLVGLGRFVLKEEVIICDKHFIRHWIIPSNWLIRGHVKTPVSFFNKLCFGFQINSSHQLNHILIRNPLWHSLLFTALFKLHKSVYEGRKSVRMRKSLRMRKRKRVMSANWGDVINLCGPESSQCLTCPNMSCFDNTLNYFSMKNCDWLTQVINGEACSCYTLAEFSSTSG